MADNLQKVLSFIIDNPLMREASREAQLDATAVQDVGKEIKAIATNRHEDAERLGPYFARGLRMAAGASGPLVVDDTDPMGNDIADAFARYLVSTDLATSQSAPLAGGHFRYTFEVDWPRLRDIARQSGVDLDVELRAGQ